MIRTVDSVAVDIKEEEEMEPEEKEQWLEAIRMSLRVLTYAPTSMLEEAREKKGNLRSARLAVGVLAEHGFFSLPYVACRHDTALGIRLANHASLLYAVDSERAPALAHEESQAVLRSLSGFSGSPVSLGDMLAWSLINALHGEKEGITQKREEWARQAFGRGFSSPVWKNVTDEKSRRRALKAFCRVLGGRRYGACEFISNMLKPLLDENYLRDGLSSSGSSGGSDDDEYEDEESIVFVEDKGDNEDDEDDDAASLAPSSSSSSSSSSSVSMYQTEEEE